MNNHLLSDSDDSLSGPDFNDTEWQSDSNSDDVDELEGEELVESLNRARDTIAPRAYRGGLLVRDVQFTANLKAFSSRKYTSH